jgi:hypothetical protein
MILINKFILLFPAVKKSFTGALANLNIHPGI